MNNGHEPATKADLEELREELRADLKENVAMLRSEFQHGFDDLKETLRDTQTELLKAFYSFATTNQQRLTQLEGNEAAVVARLGTLEARVTDLERKINFPAQQ